MRRALWVLAFGLASCGPAIADPFITPLLIAAGVSATAGITIGVTTITYVSILSAIITTAIGIGLTLLFSPRPPKPPAPENGAIAVQLSTPFSIYAFGTVRLSGALMLKEEVAGNLVYVAALARQQFVRFTGIFLNDDAVIVPAVGNRIGGNVPSGADLRYNANVISIDTKLGLVPETAHSHIIIYGPSVWGSSFRGDGIASISMVCRYATSKTFAALYPYQVPQLSTVADTLAVYDPRDVTQSATNPATWLFSKNTALQLLHFECFSIFGPRRVYATAIAPVLASWITAANDCDDAMALKAGGTEPRYQSGFWTTTEQDRRTSRQTLLTTCDGHFVEQGDGTIVLRVGKYRAPTVFLTDDDIIGFRIDHGKASDDTINQATAKYTSPANNYITVETSPLFNTADQALRPGPPKNAQLDLVAVQSTGQASRLLKREMSRQNEQKRGTLTIRLSGINACYERWIGINSNTIPGLSGVVIENRKPVISLQSMSCTIDFIMSGPQIDTYDAATDESPPPNVPQRPATVGLPVPSNVAVVVQQINDASGNTSVYLDVEWDRPYNNGNPWNLDYQLQTRIHDTGGGVPGAWGQSLFDFANIGILSTTRIHLDSAPVLVGVSLDVQLFSVASGRSLSTGSVVVTVSTDITTSAPSSPTGLTATGGTGQVALAATNPNSANFSAVQFYRAAHLASFATAVPVGPLQYGAPRGASAYTNTVAAGTYDYYATAQNASGVASSPVGPVVGTST